MWLCVWLCPWVLPRLQEGVSPAGVRYIATLVQPNSLVVTILSSAGHVVAVVTGTKLGHAKKEQSAWQDGPSLT